MNILNNPEAIVVPYDDIIKCCQGSWVLIRRITSHPCFRTVSVLHMNGKKWVGLFCLFNLYFCNQWTGKLWYSYDKMVSGSSSNILILDYSLTDICTNPPCEESPSVISALRGKRLASQNFFFISEVYNWQSFMMPFCSRD